MLSEIQYLPPVEFFVHLLEHEKLLIEGNENFQKQSYRNRCYIKSANNIQELSVPIKKTGEKVLISEAEIDYSQKWLMVHWRSLCSAYGNAPFFEYYSIYFEQIFFKKHKFLFDLDMELLLLCLKLLGLSKKIEITQEYCPVTSYITGDIKDMRGGIHPKFLPDKIVFKEYPQVFGKDFVKNLSIVDLLFCEGNNSLSILQQSINEKA